VKQFPVLVIIINGISRSALYSTGSGTNELKFKYTVLVGDTSPPALVCKMISVLSDGHIFHLSSNPINSVDLTLPHKDHVLAGSEEIYINTNSAPRTSVLSVSTPHVSGKFGIGEVVQIQIKFTDFVFCRGKVKPILELNSNSTMEYESGTGTNILKFSRIMSKEDASLDELNWKIKLLSNSSLVCTNPKCLIQNGIEKNVDLSFLDYNGEPFISPLNSSILIDSSIPMIRNIYSIVQRQHYCYQNISILMQNIQCNFTAGDSITVMVKYSSPIVVSGFGPHLKMYLGNKMSGFKTIYAMYNSTLSNDTDLAFSYEIEIGTAGFFLWRCIDLPCSISLGKGFTFIRQKSTTPTLNVNLTIPQNLVVDELKDKHN